MLIFFFISLGQQCGYGQPCGSGNYNNPNYARVPGTTPSAPYYPGPQPYQLTGYNVTQGYNPYAYGPTHTYNAPHQQNDNTRRN